MTTFGCLVLDCADPQALADFWAAAPGYVTLGAAGKYGITSITYLPGDHPKMKRQVPDNPSRVHSLPAGLRLGWDDSPPSPFVRWGPASCARL